MQSAVQMFVARFASEGPQMQSAMQMFVARFASEGPQMQSAMQMFVARFASEGPRRARLAHSVWTFSTEEVQAVVFGVEKVRRISATYRASGSFGFAQDDGFVVVRKNKLSAAALILR